MAPTVTEMALDPSIAYRADEQIAWLAAELMGGNPPTLDWCPHEKRGEYAEKIASFLRDHPFRSEARWASPVFSSYVASQVFGDMRVRDALNEVGRSTGLLFDFVLNQEAAAEIDEWQFAALHDSMLAGEWQDVTAEVAIAPDQDTEVLDEIGGQLHLAEGTRTRGTDFVLTLDKPGELHLYGSTAFLSADFPGRVIVHEHNGSTTLGPDAYIACADLLVRGESVEAARRPPQPGVSDRPVDVSIVVEVTGTFEISGRLVGAPPPDLLEIRVPQDAILRHPWVSYRQPLVPTATTPDERARRFLNMLMNLLRRHGHGGSMAVFDKKLQGRQSIKHGELKAVLAALQDMGIIDYTGGLIFLDRGWEQHWFSGKARTGLPSLDEKLEAWDPVLKRISAVLAG